MKNSSLRIYLLVFVLAISACQKEVVPPSVYEVPALIQPYVDLFEQEASKRGLDLDIDNLRVEFATDLNDGDAAGLCTFPSAGDPTPRIQLDTTSFNWTSNEYHREILVFHELGHCVLNRLHRDGLLPNGNFVSIMRSTGEQVYGGLLNDFKREYYLDELFNESVPVPDWAKDIPTFASVDPSQKQEIFSDDFNNNANGWNLGTGNDVRSAIAGGVYIFESKTENSAFFTTKDIPIDVNEDFEIEANIKIVSGSSSSMMQWGGSGGNDLYFFGFNNDSSAFAGNWTVGVAAASKFDAVIPNEFNKLTIRKIDQFYYLYINEQYYDVLSFEDFFGDLFAFYIGPNTLMHVDYLRISSLSP